MTDFLARFAARQLGQIETIEPRIKPVYASPIYGAEGPSILEEILPKAASQPNEETKAIPISHFGEGTLESAHRPGVASRNNQVPEPPVKAHTESREGTRHSALNPAVQTHAEIASSNFAKLSPAQSPEHIRPFAPPESLPRRLAGEPPDMARPNFVPSDTAATMAPAPLVKPAKDRSTLSMDRLSAPLSLPTRKEPVDDLQKPVTEAPVRVTIGRIEVTALTEAAPSKRVAAERKPKRPLDEYLARRHGRNR